MHGCRQISKSSFLLFHDASLCNFIKSWFLLFHYASLWKFINYYHSYRHCRGWFLRMRKLQLLKTRNNWFLRMRTRFTLRKRNNPPSRMHFWDWKMIHIIFPVTSECPRWRDSRLSRECYDIQKPEPTWKPSPSFAELHSNIQAMTECKADPSETKPNFHQVNSRNISNHVSINKLHTGFQTSGMHGEETSNKYTNLQ